MKLFPTKGQIAPAIAVKSTFASDSGLISPS